MSSKAARNFLPALEARGSLGSRVTHGPGSISNGRERADPRGTIDSDAYVWEDSSEPLPDRLA